MKPSIKKKMEKVKNLYFTTDWMRIPKVLTHPSVKIFLHHGGMNSMRESLYAGVPMIINPIRIDQHRNCFQAELIGWGKCIEAVSGLQQAILSIANSPDIYEEVRKIRETMLIQEEDEEARLESYVIQVAEEETKHLKPRYYQHLRKLQLIDLDVHFFVFTIVYTMLFSLVSSSSS